MSVDVVGLRALAEKARETPDFSYGMAHKKLSRSMTPDVVLALLDEITTLRAEKDDAVREMHSRELHHFEEEQRSAQLDADLADRDARIEAAEAFARKERDEIRGRYDANHAIYAGYANACDDILALLSGPAVPVPQDNPEATHVGIMVRSRQSGRTREMIDALLARANELGVRVEIIEPEPTAEPTRDTLTLIARDVHLYDKGECAALSGPHARRIANAILAAFDVRPREQS